jgi:hypothetical protein
MNTLPGLRSDYINAKTTSIYSLSIARFLLFLYEEKENADTEIEENPLTNDFDLLIEANGGLSEAGKRRLVKQKLMLGTPPAFIDFDRLNDSHFMLFVLSLESSNGQSLSFSSYNIHRAGFNHLYTIYRKMKPPEVNHEISLYYKALKKRAAIQAHAGIGQLHRAKQPLPFPVYRLIAKGFFSAVPHCRIFAICTLAAFWRKPVTAIAADMEGRGLVYPAGYSGWGMVHLRQPTDPKNIQHALSSAQQSS